MTQRAVALVFRPPDRDGAASAASTERRPVRAGSPRRPSRRLGRGQPYLLLLVGLVVAVWLVVVFGRALTQLNEAGERAAAVRSETAALEMRLEAVRAEADIVQSDAFMAMQARQFGMGLPGERAFALSPGAPPPPVVALLGSEPGQAAGTSPFEAWLRLLFGRD
jgi:hypothetical protein